jgi:CHAT domain-containing protein
LAHYRRGDLDAAGTDWESLLRVLGEKGFNEVFAQSWFAAADFYRDFPYPTSGGDDPAVGKRAGMVRRCLDLGIHRAEAARAGLGVRGAAAMTQVLYLYYAGVDFAALSGDPAGAFGYSEALRSRGFLEQLGTEAALALLPGGAEKDRVRELTGRIGNLRTVLEAYAHRNPEGEDNQNYVRALGELEAAEGALAALDAAIAERIPRYGELRNPRPAGIEAARSYCGEDTAVLEYVLWEGSDYIPVRMANVESFIGKPPAINSYCLVITKDGVIPVRLDPAFDYSGTVTALRDKMFRKQGRRIIPLPEANFEAERNALYKTLIAPALEHIPGNIKNLLIVPDGSLAYLPFDMLRKDNGKDSPDLGETYRISLSPSVSVSVQASQRRDPDGEPFLGFGGALYNGYYGSFEDGKPMFWEPLNSSALEVTTIQNRFAQNPRIFTGREASEARIKAMSADGSLAAYPIIHFACHGYFNPREPAMSGILLSEISGQMGESGEDGNLSIEEVMLLGLNARMVLLSACDTALGEIKRGDGMVGFTRSFMTAGARNVGVSLWKIDDHATASFMTRLYRYVKDAGMSFREAYYQTRKAFREDRMYAHPYYWAAFTMYE